MKDILAWSGSLLAISLYLPTLYYIWTNKLTQSFATWTLWVALDGIVLGSTIIQGGENTGLLKCYVTGGSLVAISLLLKGHFKWGLKEWLTLLMVITCMVIWKLSPWWATVASTFAVVFSTIPQYLESRQSGYDKITGLIYLGFAFANFLCFLAGKEWTMADRFYYGMMVPVCLSVVSVTLRKKEN